MNKSLFIIAGIAILALVAGPALAGAPAKDDRVSKLVGAQAVSTNNEHLGTIDDLVVGSDGRVSYLVIAKSDQSRLVALPFETANPRPKSNGAVMLDISKDIFDVAPSFAKNEWPDLSSPKHDSARGYRGDSMDSEKNVINGISTWNPYPF
jgi:sporulation protein YlmC with PRC-barrel domain